MGAFGCALYAKEHAGEGASSIISAEDLENFSYTSKSAQCNGCTAHCQLNVINFGKGRRFISGNRCEKGGGTANRNTVPNLYEYKYDSILNTVKSNQPRKYRGNWKSDFRLRSAFTSSYRSGTPCSPRSDSAPLSRTKVLARQLYYLGQHTIPSDTVCYPAKLTHGHIENLLNKGVDFIFDPCMSYNIDEGNSDNHFNCPVVAYYPELLLANNNRLTTRTSCTPTSTSTSGRTLSRS